MLHKGYINFFEDQCCFVGSGEDKFFAKLRAGDVIVLQNGERAELTAGEGRLTYRGAPEDMQGLMVSYDDSEA